MTDKIIFFNTGWMDLYKGLTNDTIKGGGKYVKDTGWGHELFNFRVFQNHFFGYVQPKIDKKYHNPDIIKLENMGANKNDSEIAGVTVVWTASHPTNGGTYIVGWYKNATVYRYAQAPPDASGREYKNNKIAYFTKAEASNCTLLPFEKRIVLVRRMEKNWMGHSNVWFARDNPEFIKLVKDYIFNGVDPLKKKNSGGGKGWKQPDPLKRIAIETKAIKIVTKYYDDLGYTVTSDEKDNVGWDLSAQKDKTTLKLEVKGLSGKEILTELTPNEYKNLNADKQFYRLCIVTNALVQPILKIYAYSYESNKWSCEDGTVIKFDEIVSARITAK